MRPSKITTSAPSATPNGDKGREKPSWLAGQFSGSLKLRRSVKQPRRYQEDATEVVFVPRITALAAERSRTSAIVDLIDTI
jgi:hypothetical protein